MVLELVEGKDCIVCSRNKSGKEKGNDGEKRFKKITNRDRRRCFKCGHGVGQWYEYFLKGKREYHFLCRSCIDTIEGV